MYQDEKLICKDCGAEFIFTAGEQEFYAEKGFQNKPQRCKACRDARKNAGKPQRELYTTTCARCGKVMREKSYKRLKKYRVGKDYYCRDCYMKYEY